MANGKKNKFSIDLGFNVTDQPSLSEQTSDLPDTTNLNFDFSRPIDRVDMNLPTYKSGESTWYPTKYFLEGVEQGYKGIEGGWNYLQTLDGDLSSFDKLELLKEFEKSLQDAPPPAEDFLSVKGLGQFLGQLVPSALTSLAGVGTAFVTKNPYIGGAVASLGFGGLAVSSFGQGMKEYDTYKLSKGEDPFNTKADINLRYGQASVNERKIIGATYGAFEFIGETIPFVKFIPKTFRNLAVRGAGDKIMKRSFHPELSDEFIESANKSFINFAKKNNANKKLATKLLGLGSLEGAGEVVTEVGQSFGDYLITEDKTAFDNIAQESGKAFLGGLLMGTGLGRVSYGAQNNMNKQRRENQQNLFFTEHDDKFQEIVNIKEKDDGSKEFTLMDAYGDVTPKVKDTEIKGQIVNLSNDQFNAILKSKQDDINLQDEAFIYNNNFELEQQKVKLIDLGKFVNSQQKKGEETNPVINIANINGDDIVITGRGDADSNILFGFKLSEYSEGGTANVEVFRTDQIENNEIKSVNVDEATSLIEQQKKKNIEIVESSSRPVIGQKFNIADKEWKVVGSSANEVRIQDKDGDVETLDIAQYTELNTDTDGSIQENTETTGATISLDQIQFNEDGNIIPEIKPKDAVAEKFEIGKKTFKVKSLNKETGSRELSEVYKTQKTAQKYADLLNEEYGNQTFEIEDRTDKNDPLAKNNFIIVAKPKINDNQIKKIKAKAKEIQAKEKVFSPAADDVLKAIETNQGKEQADIFKAEYDRLVEKTIQARQKKEKAPKVKGEKVYHGSPTKITGNTIKRGSEEAIFVTPQKEYASIYMGTSGDGTITELTLTKNKISKLFDLRNPKHVEKLKEGFIKNNEQLEVEYDSKESALRDYDNAIKSMRESSREGLNDWATGGNYMAQMENAGFEGAIFSERPNVISYALFDKEITVSKPRETVKTKKVTKKETKKTTSETKTKKKVSQKPKVVIKKVDPQIKIKFSREFFQQLPQVDEKRDKGMYFTRVVSPLNKNQVKKVETIINRIKGSWKNSPNTIVYQSLDDYRLDNGQANVDKFTNAFYDHDNDQIVFFADMFTDAGKVQKKFYHETIGHQGLKGIFSDKELNQNLDSVFAKLDPKNITLQQIVFSYHHHSLDNSLIFDPKKNYLNEVKPNGFSLTLQDKRDIAEEYIANEAEKVEVRATTNRLVKLFNTSIQKLTGKKPNLLDKEVKEIIQASKQYLKVGDQYVNKNAVKQATANNYNVAGGKDTKKASSSRVLQKIKQNRDFRRSQLASQVEIINDSIDILEKDYKKGKTVNTAKGKDVVSMKLIENLLGKNNKADEQYLKLANIIKDYNQVKGSYSENITDINEAKQVFDEIKLDIKSNLLFIYNSIDPDIRNISKLWYDSSHSTIAKKFSDEYGITRDQASGIIAVMSPQKDWFRNIGLAERVLKIAIGNKGYAFDQNMANYILNSVDAKGNKIFLKNLKTTERKKKVNSLVGKKIQQLDGTDVGLFIRAFDWEYLGDRSYYNYSPTGDVIGKVKTKLGLDSKIAWGSTGEIAKAVSIIQNGSKENISDQLGDQHKVRSFYNNISDPKDVNSVTIDTHAIASAYLLPLSGSSPITLLGLGGSPSSLVTGVKGSYGLIADAYREVATDLKILPRELQSIVWEGIRGFYSDTFKRNKNSVLQVTRIWEDYKLGNIKDKKEVFKKLKEIGGDFNNPVWLENVLNGDNTQVEQKAIDQDLANLDVDVLEGQENAEAEKVFKQSRDYVNSEQFKKFFVGSTVINSDGSPKVMFHGSPATDNINQIWFNSKYIGQGNDQLGAGFYFSSEPMEAGSYSESYILDGDLDQLMERILTDRIKRRIGDTKFSPGIVPVYLSIKNPMPNVFGTTKEQVKKLILASPLAQSKDEYVNPFVDWFPEFGELIKQKDGLDYMADQVADSYSDFSDNGTNMIQTRRTQDLIMNDFYEGGQLAPVMLKAIQDIYGYDGYILDQNIGDRTKLTVVAFFPEQIQSALQTDIPINNTPIKKSIHMDYPYNENKRDNLINKMLNSLYLLPENKKIGYGELVRHFVQYTGYDIPIGKWLGINDKIKNKKLLPSQIWDIISEQQIDVLDLTPNSNSKLFVLSKKYNKQRNEENESFIDSSLDFYIRGDIVERTLILLAGKDVSKNIDVVTAHKKLIKYATVNNIDNIISTDIKSLNQIKTTHDFKAPISKKRFETSTGFKTYYNLELTPVLKRLSLKESNISQSLDLELTTGVKKSYDEKRWLLQDDLLFLKRLQNEIEERTGKKIKDYNNAYVLENLSKGKILNSFEKFEFEYETPLKNAISDIVNDNQNIFFQDINDYVYAKHALERNKIKPSGMSNEKATEIVTEFEKTVSKKQVNSLIDVIKDINRFYVQLAYDSGLITKERYNVMFPTKKGGKKQMFDFYVPLRGFEESETDNSIFVDLNKKMKGRVSKADSPLAYLLASAQTVITQAEKNKYKLALYNLLLENPDSKSYEIKNLYYKEVDGKIIEDDVKGDKGKLTISEKDYKLGKQIQRFQMSGDPRLTTISVKVNGQRKVIEFFGDDNIKIAQGINKYIDPESKAGKFQKLASSVGDFGGPFSLSRINGIMRSFFTQYSPEFIPINFFRDITAGLINITVDFDSSTRNAVLKETFKSMGALKGFFAGNKRKFPKGKEGDMLKLFIENGTRTGYSQPRTVDELKKSLNDFDKILEPTDKGIKFQTVKKLQDGSYTFGKSILDLLDQTNLILENTVRYSAFKVLVNKGESVDTASKYAKDLTVNFNKKGMLTNDIAKNYLFFNAGVQSVERITRPFFTGKAGRAASVFATIAAAGFFNQMAVRLIAGEDEDGKYFYDKLPEYVRNKNIIIVNPLWLLGLSDVKFKTFPLPYGFNAIYSVSDPIVRYGLGYQSFASSAASMADNVAESFSPLGSVNSENRTFGESVLSYIAPTALQPVIELMQNKNFMGSRIYPEDNPFSKDEKPGFRSAYSNSADYAVFISKAFNKLSGGDKFEKGFFSPKPQQIEYLVNQYLGGVGATVNRSVKIISNTISGRPIIEDVNDIPIVRRFATQSEKYDEYGVYYDMLNFMKQAQDRERSFRKDIKEREMSRKEYNEKMNEKKPDAFNYTLKELIRLEKRTSGIVERVKKLRDDRNKAIDNDNYELAQKKEADILKQMKKFNKFVTKGRYQSLPSGEILQNLLGEE